MLGTQFCLDFAESIRLYLTQCLVTLGEFFLGGILPGVVPDTGAYVKVAFQVLDIADHQGIVLLLGSLDDLIGIEPVIILVASEIGLPVVTCNLVDTLTEFITVVQTEQVDVVCSIPATCHHRHAEHDKQANENKSFHRFLVYIC